MKLRTGMLIALLLVGGVVFPPSTKAYMQKSSKMKLSSDTSITTMLEEKVDELSSSRVSTILRRVESVKPRFMNNKEIYDVLVILEELLKQKLATSSIAETAAGSDEFSVLVQALSRLDLVETMDQDGPFTVFAPTDEAFADLLAELNISAEELLDNETLLQSVVTYHVIPGVLTAYDAGTLDHGTMVETLQGEKVIVNNLNGVVIDQSKVTSADMFATNGVIHVIDSVLLPPTVKTMLGMETMRGSSDIIETAVASEMFPTLVAAVQAAGLVDALKDEGPYSVFAPTEEAFGILLSELGLTAEELLANTELLTSVLTYHVVPGRYTAKDVVGLSGPTMLPTVNGTKVTVDPHNGTPIIQDANIIQTDIFTSNGVIHVIDKVILP